MTAKTNFLFVVVDAQNTIVGRHFKYSSAEANLKYKGDKIKAYNREYKWGETWRK